MLLFSTMFVIVNIFFSPFAPSLSSDRVLLFARRRSFTFQLGTLLRDSLLLFFFIYLFTPSDLCACCASLQSFTIVEILFGFFVCMSSILHFFFVVVMASPHSIIIIHQASLKCMRYLSVADLHVLSSSLLSEKSQIFNQKRNCLQSSAGGW